MKIHVSNRVEDLVKHYVEAIRPAADPFAAEVIAIQSRGMGQWLQMRLAEARGIAANIRFVDPAQVLQDAMAAVGVAPPEPDDPWSPGRLSWHILAAFSDLSDPVFQPLSDYLEAHPTTRDRRAAHLASRVADVFYRYALHRPGMASAWETNDPGGDWQAALWRTLTKSIATPSPAGRLGQLIAQLDSDVPLPSDFPQRITLFGVNTLPAAVVKAFVALGLRVDVQLYLMAPGPSQSQHPLRESFDRLGSDLETLLTAQDVDASYAFAPPSGAHLLGALQRDILSGQIPDALHGVADDDRSLQIHACHSPLRQVEVLRDRLLDVFDHDDSLQPRDVLVMTPDIETYAPLISAVFRDGDGGKEGDPARGFPILDHQVHDLSLRRENPVAEAFLAVLSLVDALALTVETLATMTEFETRACRLLSIENLTAFEEEVRRGLPDDTIAVFTGGFPHGQTRGFLTRACIAGIAVVDHWGDLDLGGVRILKHLGQLLPVPVRPFRMEASLLDRLPTQPLTERDREGMALWLADPEAPCRALVEAMLARDVKAEQEGWFLAT